VALARKTLRNAIAGVLVVGSYVHFIMYVAIVIIAGLALGVHAFAHVVENIYRVAAANVPFVQANVLVVVVMDACSKVVQTSALVVGVALYVHMRIVIFV